jgi:Rps23 Pro-64 3,4-dihydroxylase Tpa1-like proline 4-hydroxylase
MLLLFNVDEHSKHFVTQVAPHAQGKRLAVSGWWYGKLESKNTGLGPAVSEENQRIEFI